MKVEDNWYIVQAILRCASCMEPTIALKHQITRLKDFYMSNGMKDRVKIIEDIMSPREDGEYNAKLVQS